MEARAITRYDQATETTSGPDVAPDGIVMEMDVALHELMVTGAPFRFTTLPP